MRRQPLSCAEGASACAAGIREQLLERSLRPSHVEHLELETRAQEGRRNSGERREEKSKQGRRRNNTCHTRYAVTYGGAGGRGSQRLAYPNSRAPFRFFGVTKVYLSAEGDPLRFPSLLHSFTLASVSIISLSSLPLYRSLTRPSFFVTCPPHLRRPVARVRGLFPLLCHPFTRLHRAFTRLEPLDLKRLSDTTSG